MSESKRRNRLIMMITGGLMLLVSVVYLFLIDDPFPMWLIIGGAGVMFIGVGRAIQNGVDDIPTARLISEDESEHPVHTGQSDEDRGQSEAG